MNGVWQSGVGALLLVNCVAGCGSHAAQEGDTSSRKDPLYLETPTATWPGRTIPYCWLQTDPDNVPYASIPTSAFNAEMSAGWVRATGLYFQDKGVCDPSMDPIVHVSLITRPGGSGTLGMQPNGGTLTVSAPDVNHISFAYIGIHEMGHILGFGHEHNRPDTHTGNYEACIQQAPDQGSNQDGGTLNTPPDSYSIMAYCGTSRLSFWDAVGAQQVYGFPTQFADVNGDGKQDAIAVDYGGIRVFLSTGSGLASAQTWSSGSFFGRKGTFFVDVDGDGKADAVAIDNDGTWVRRSAGTSFGTPEHWSDTFYGQIQTALADVDGDGKADLIAVDPGHIRVRTSTGSAFDGLGATWLVTNNLVSLGPLFFADVTGDGFADMVALEYNGAYVYPSAGTYFRKVPVRWTTDDASGGRGAYLADVNGDRKLDLVTVQLDGVEVRLSNGSAFGAASHFTTDGTVFGRRGNSFGDMDGDGLADYVMVNDYGAAVRYSTGSAFVINGWNSFAGAMIVGSRSVPSCVDGVKNGSETDVDCGGNCLPCDVNKACTTALDCVSGSCVNSTCHARSTCADGVKDGDETDVDCGGSCAACAYATCSDGVKNGGETGVDCGGPCQGCALGVRCSVNQDCASRACGAFRCADLCHDGMRDGDETGVDCGGGCTACAPGSTCQGSTCSDACHDGTNDFNETGLDCGGACAPCSLFCSDGAKNGDESDLDCGGSCSGCALGKRCHTNSDCQSGHCSGAWTCIAP
jgi:hypothetical protein